jgi:hypothetical protein
MPGLIREARDMQGIKDSARKDREAKSEPPQSGGDGPKKKG